MSKLSENRIKLLEKIAGEKVKARARGTCCLPAEHSMVKDNKDHYPINDAAQARNALSRVSQHSGVPPWFRGTLSSLVNIVRRKVKAKYPSIEVSTDNKKRAERVGLLTKLARAPKFKVDNIVEHKNVPGKPHIIDRITKCKSQEDDSDYYRYHMQELIYSEESVPGRIDYSNVPRSDSSSKAEDQISLLAENFDDWLKVKKHKKSKHSVYSGELLTKLAQPVTYSGHVEFITYGQIYDDYEEIYYPYKVSVDYRVTDDNFHLIFFSNYYLDISLVKINADLPTKTTLSYDTDPIILSKNGFFDWLQILPELKTEGNELNEEIDKSLPDDFKKSFAGEMVLFYVMKDHYIKNNPSSDLINKLNSEIIEYDEDVREKLQDKYNELVKEETPLTEEKKEIVNEDPIIEPIKQPKCRRCANDAITEGLCYRCNKATEEMNKKAPPKQQNSPSRIRGRIDDFTSSKPTQKYQPQLKDRIIARQNKINKIIESSNVPRPSYNNDTSFAKLANKILNKFAADANSEIVTNAVRITINNLIQSNNFSEKLNEVIENMKTSAYKAKKDLHGSVKITDFITNASLQGGVWKLDLSKSYFKIESSWLLTTSLMLGDDNQPIPNQKIENVKLEPTSPFMTKLNNLLKSFNTAAINTVNSSLNLPGNKQALGDGTTITNHETAINSITAEC